MLNEKEKFFKTPLYDNTSGKAAEKILQLLVNEHLSYSDAVFALEIAQRALENVTYPTFE